MLNSASSGSTNWSAQRMHLIESTFSSQTLNLITSLKPLNMGNDANWEMRFNDFVNHFRQLHLPNQICFQEKNLIYQVNRLYVLANSMPNRSISAFFEIFIWVNLLRFNCKRINRITRTRLSKTDNYSWTTGHQTILPDW